MNIGIVMVNIIDMRGPLLSITIWMEQKRKNDINMVGDIGQKGQLLFYIVPTGILNAKNGTIRIIFLEKVMSQMTYVIAKLEKLRGFIGRGMNKLLSVFCAFITEKMKL